ncbi:MAG: alpha/beta hydrolase [Phototrophicaceae bacterium]|jgi:alpha-beta hydrolase superfamily lysophospholipase
MQHTSEMIASNDGTRLYLQSWSPETPPRAVVPFVHGWNDHSGRYMNLVNALIPAGFAAIGVDLRGNGKSEGQAGYINRWEEYRADITALLDTVSSRYPNVPQFLLGHSNGGLAVMDYVIHHPDRPLRGLLLSSPFLAEAKVSPIMSAAAKVLSSIAPRFSMNPGADVNTISRDPAVVQAYVNDPLLVSLATPRFATENTIARAFVLANLDAIQLPTLCMYGSADGLVPPQVTRDAFVKIGSQDKTRHEYEGSYHELINDLDKEKVLADIVVWLTARL